MSILSKERLAVHCAALLFAFLTSCGLAETRTKMYVPRPFDSEGGKSVVSVYDLKDGRLVSTIHTVPAATFAKVTPDGKHVWIFSSKEREVEVYTTATDELMSGPYLDIPACDAVFDPDGKTCYTANGSLTGEGDNSISYIDVEKQLASYTIATGRNPVSLAIQKDGSRLYVANQKDNSITVIDPKQYRMVTTLYAGIEPYDLVLSNAGRYLFVANRGVDLGSKGGSCVTVIETATGNVVKVIETGNAPTSLGLTPDGRRMVVSHVDRSYVKNLWYFDMSYQSNEVGATVIDRITVGKGTAFGTVDPSGRLFVVPDYLDGGIHAIDMLQPGSVTKIGTVDPDRAYFVEFATVDVSKELTLRESIMRDNPLSLEGQKAAFETAYLLNLAGNQNAVITTYNSIIENYPGTLSEAKALFKMGDLCYDQQLVSNAADYYNRGLTAYGELLRRGDSEQQLHSEIILDAAERLGELAAKLDENYFVDLYKLYANVSLKLDELPKLFFSFGVALRRLNDSKFAGKCFAETENRLIELMDETLYQEMKFKIDLVRSNPRAVLSAVEVDENITVDGFLDEWEKAEPISLNRRENVIVNQMRWLDRSDISGTFYAGYDEYNFYIAVEALDDRVFRQDSSNGDYVGIYLDLREGSGDYLTREKEIGEGVYSVQVMLPPEDGGRFRIKSNQEMEPMVGGMISSEGYVFELKIPLAYLRGLTPKEGRRIGLGIELFDLDSGNSGDPPKVVGWLMPAKSAYGPRFSELFGILEFR